MALKHERNDYFKMIDELVQHSLDAAIYLNNTLNNFSLERLDKDREELHNIEHNADIKKHTMMKKLAKEFIPPIEREDIMQLAQEIDDVTDTIEDVLINIHIYNITKIRPEAIQFTNLIVECCKALKKISEEFSNFKKSKVIHNEIVTLNHLEEEGDRIFTESMMRIFREPTDFVETIAWKDIFSHLEKCCDSCEHVSDVIEGVIMKNS